MQLYGLPTDSPDLEADYLAIDDGVSARKSLFSAFDVGYNPVTFTSGDTGDYSTYQSAGLVASDSLMDVLANISTAVSNVRYLYSVLGDSALETSASTITAGVNEIVEEIGSTAMTTTADTITGAIAEIMTTLNALPDLSTYQTDTTTWISPTITDSSCTITSGGYFEEGKHTYVQLRILLTSALEAGTSLQIMSGLPAASPNYGVLNIIFSNNGGGSAYVSTSGNLLIKTPDSVAASTSTNIYITGHYVTA